MEQAKGNDMNEAKAMRHATDDYVIQYADEYVKGAAIDFEAGWQAALKWRDSHVGEPKAWGNLSEDFADSERVLITNEVDAKKYHEQVYNLTPLFTTPPTAQINEQMREALEFFVDRFEPMRNELIFSKRLAIDKAKAALDAATPK